LGIETQKKNDFTKGTMAGNILKMAAPMTLALVINVLYSVVDRMYIGHMEGVGTVALAGIGLTIPIIAVISAFQSLCSSGGAPLCSIARGEGNNKKAELILGNAFSLLLILGVILTAVGLAVKEPVLRAAGATDNTFEYADEYMETYLFGTVFVMIGLGMNAFINAQGFARTGMLTVLLGAVVNIALDPVFIFVFDMGVRGAALATIIAQLCSTVWVIGFLTGKKAILKLRLKNLRLSGKVVAKTLSLGVSGFTMAVTGSAVGILNNAKLQVLGGDIYISVMAVVNSLREIVIMPNQGITAGAQPVLGYNYGARRYSRVRDGIKTVFLLSLAVNAFMWILMLALPALFIRIFNSDPGLLEAGIPGIRIYFMLFVFMALQLTGQCVFTGLGMAKHAVFFSILRKGILVIPLILLLPRLFGLGVNGVFLAEPISDVLGGCACFATMYFTVWRKLEKE